MRIAVWGLGHVGQITAAYLSAWTRHTVLALDVNDRKIAALRRYGTGPRNPLLRDTFSNSVREGTLQLVHLTRAAVLPPVDAHFICVDTPTVPDGTQDLSSIRAVCTDLCSRFSLEDGKLVVVRSTVLPGTTDNLIAPLLHTLSGKRERRDFHVLVVPCFARDIDFSEDLRTATRIVLGASSRVAVVQLRRLLKVTQVRAFRASRVTAELAKYADNAFHALKVVFANEVAAVANQLYASKRQAMDIVCADARLSVSAAYLSPGSPYAGRCLPKDMVALTELVARLPVYVPLLKAIHASNSHRGADRTPRRGGSYHRMHLTAASGAYGFLGPSARGGR